MSDAPPPVASGPTVWKLPVKPIINDVVLKSTLIAMVIVLFIAWVLMMLAARKISEAQKNGTWTQKLCGLEYMEAETERYKLAQAYESYSKRLIYAAIAIFMTLGMLGLVIFAGLGLDTSFRMIFLNKAAIQTFLGNDIKMLTTIFTVITGTLLYPLIALGTTWGDLIGERSYAEPATLADAEKVLKEKKNPVLIQATIIGGLFSAILLYIFYTQYAKPSGEVAAAAYSVPSPVLFGGILGLFFIGMGLTIALTKSYTYLNAWFSDYNTKISSLNTNINSLLSDDALKRPTSDYLSDNIKRLNPKADLDLENSLELNYKNEKYAYLFHMDGNEVEFLEKTTITPSYAQAIITELKVDLDRLVDSLESRSKFKANLDTGLLKMLTSISGRAIKPDITVTLLQRVVEDAFRSGNTIVNMPISLNNSIRIMLEGILAPEKPIKVSELRTAIYNEIDTKAKSTPQMGKADMKQAVETRVFAKVFRGITPGPELDNTTLGSTSTDPRRVALLDAFSRNSANGLSEIIISQTLVSYLTDRVAAIITQMDQTNSQQSDLRTKLSELRRFQLGKESNKFIQMVFIWSIILITLFFFGIFHYFYQISPSLVTMFTAGTILVLVFILTFYGWFMGQTMV